LHNIFFMPITDETRSRIFDKLKKTLEKYSPPMVAIGGSSQQSFELIGNKEVPYGSDKKMVPGMYFASIAHRKDSVVFYLLPCYYDTRLAEKAPSLFKCLKGKTCFHFKKEDQINEPELELLLQEGLKAWELAGYMK
jgi:hypothetical protein